MFLLKCIFFSISSFSQVFDGVSGDEASIYKILNQSEESQVLIMTELHGYSPHHENQRNLLVHLANRPRVVSVGMEHFAYPLQDAVDDYVRGSLDEADFLTQMGWGKGLSFDHYRLQVRIPRYTGGRTLALNIPRYISGKVARSGLESLSADERTLLPPLYSRGSEDYFERFKEVMENHIPESMLENYFMAQSLWDDTMAWTTARQLATNPEELIVILVGDFHAIYGHGLVERLRANGVDRITVVSQVLKKDEALPHPVYGPRSDYIWVSEEGDQP